MPQYARISEQVGWDEPMMELAEQNPLSALLFLWSLTQVDKEGSAPTSPLMYRAAVCPAASIELETIAGAIDAQVEHGLLTPVAHNRACVKRDDKLWQFGQNISDHARRSPFLRHWRRICLQRDNYSCQLCGEVDGRLDVHHRLPFRHNKADRAIVANGITLCHKHHQHIHSAEGKPLRERFEQEYLQKKEA